MIAGGSIAAAMLFVAAPAHAASAHPQMISHNQASHNQASPGWHKVGTYNAFWCQVYQQWYLQNGARAANCEPIGNGLYDLWVLTDE